DDRKKLKEEDIRNAFGLAGKELAKKKVRHAAVYLESFQNDSITPEDAAYLAAEGIGMGLYSFADYKTSSNETKIDLENLSFLTEGDSQEIEAAAKIGSI